MTDRPGRAASPGGVCRSFIMFTLLNLILLAQEFGRNLVVAHAESVEGEIELTHFKVPSPVRPNEWHKITCLYKLHGASLHAMKLFKDDQEFYRYTPGQQPMAFPVSGVMVELRRSRSSEALIRISKNSGGRYKCQVLVEGTFNSVTMTKSMEVEPVDSSANSLSSQTGGGGGVWQHTSTKQQQQQQQRGTHARPQLSRQPHSAVQQHPSHLYGLNSLVGGGAPASLHTLAHTTLALLVWSLSMATLAVLAATGPTTLRTGRP